MTVPQMRAGTKTCTRRLGWTFLRPGDRLLAIEKGQGLKKGERQKVIGVIEVVSVTWERLELITPEDCACEGFPGLSPMEFVSMFCAGARCKESATITRVEFRHVEAGS